jgi:L-ascorbate metabolism protein UlaG (beta-lactamase superfamily)
MISRTTPELKLPVDPAFEAPDLGPGEVALWWLGQAGFAVRSGSSLVLLDPYLSDSLAAKYRGGLFPHTRLFEVPVAPEAIVGVDVVCCTHGHTDHLDPWTIRGLLAGGAKPRFVVPRAVRSTALERGVPAELLMGVTAGDRLDLGDGISLEVVPAAHEERRIDDAGDEVFLGYVLILGGVRLYHSGDCAPYPGQAELLAGRGIHAALLPVNGRDTFRQENGVPGNFTAREAIELCRAAGIPRLVPHHWGLFDFNTVDPAVAARAFEQAGTGVTWALPAVGARMVVRAGSGGTERWQGSAGPTGGGGR